MSIIENGQFKFEIYGTGLRLGVYDEKDNDHNGLKTEYVSSIIHAAIPQRVDGLYVIALGYRCLKNLPNLKTAFIPKTVKELLGDTFMNCKKLEYVTVEDGSKLSMIIGWEFELTGIVSFDVPFSVTYIGPHTFFSASKLQYLYINNLLWFNPLEIFVGVPASLVIFTPSNYPHTNFSGKSVTKILPDFNDVSMSEALIKCNTIQPNSFFCPVFVLFSLLIVFQYHYS